MNYDRDLAKRILATKSLEEAHALGAEIMPPRRLKIEQDTDPMNPRTEWDHAWQMLCAHRRYDMGDEQLAGAPDEEEVRERYDAAMVLPLYMYDHGNQVLSLTPFSCRWDSGQLGWMVLTTKALDEEFKGDRDLALACAQAEVDVYNDYLQGNVWGFVYEDGLGEEDSCWGFYGDKAYEGIADHLPEDARDLVAGAWEARYGQLTNKLENHGKSC